MSEEKLKWWEKLWSRELLDRDPPCTEKEFSECMAECIAIMKGEPPELWSPMNKDETIRITIGNIDQEYCCSEAIPVSLAFDGGYVETNGEAWYNGREAILFCIRNRRWVTLKSIVPCKIVIFNQDKKEVE